MKERILIADGDAERGRKVAAACTERGLVCRVTTHGAAALEVALSEVPDALVAQLDLPLIEGGKLSAILRANPRTQGIAVVFVGDRSDDPERHGVVGQVVPPPAEPDVVAACVQSALGARTGGDDSGAGDAAVEGQLTQLPLPDLLQLFHVGRKTGCVEVVRGVGRKGRETGRIQLREGDVVAATVGQVGGEKALFRLLAWDRGSFSFRPGEPELEPAIDTPTRALLREGMRQIREWQRMAVELPPLSASVALKIQRSSLPNVIHPLTQDVLMILDLYTKVSDVVDHCDHPDYQVLRTLHTLVQRGMVELREEEPGRDLGSDAPLFSPARAARMREWLDVDRPGHPRVSDAKILVVPNDANALRELARLLQGLPGAAIDRAAVEGEIGPDDLEALGRLAVDGELGIELLHLPPSRRFAPVWPVAGHGALATIAVLSGPASHAQETVAPVLEALYGMPRARVFHLLLLEKGERLDPEDVARNLTAVDEGSLFLLPLENAEKAARLLREMFARVLP